MTIERIQRYIRMRNYSTWTNTAGNAVIVKNDIDPLMPNTWIFKNYAEAYKWVKAKENESKEPKEEHLTIAKGGIEQCM